MVQDQPPLLELRGVHKAFGDQRILKGVSLEVRAGEFLTLLGPSGCGKTTTLRIIGGFESPDLGTVLQNGREVGGLPPYERDVHTVFQHYALFPHYDVFGNAAFALRVARLPEAEVAVRVAQALDLVKLTGFEARMPDSLSGGQQQRVALARAIAGRPALLLLDEPLGALDLKLRKEMQLELKRIQRELKIAFVYVTHDQEEALTMSDRVAVFNEGLIEQVGSPREIYDRPATPFVADFIGAANILSARLVAEVPDRHVELLLEDEVPVKLPWEGPLGIAAGAMVKVAVRPEAVRLAATREAAQPGALVLESTLKEAVYLGASTHLYLSPFERSKRVITATWTNLERRDGFSSGQKLWVQIQPQNLRLLGGTRA